MNSKYFNDGHTVWSNSSVLALLREGKPKEGPKDVILRKANFLVEQAMRSGWEGPPFNPEILVSFQGIEIAAANEPLGSEARIFPKPDGTVKIEYDESHPRTRINFSICHELVHTFFPDCYEMVRCRGQLSEEARKHKELEFLCDFGAAELLMPASAFARDFQARSASLESIVALAELYGASIEAVMIRAARFSHTSFAAAVLSEKFKPSEQKAAQTRPLGFIGTDYRPKLRVDYVSIANGFKTFIPKDKSAPADSVAYKALNFPGIQTGIEGWDIPGFGRRQVQAIALPKFGGINRVGIFFSDEYY